MTRPAVKRGMDILANSAPSVVRARQSGNSIVLVLTAAEVQRGPQDAAGRVMHSAGGHDDKDQGRELGPVP
jgi:hypothetical protein